MTAGGGRPGEPGRPPRRFRLKRSVDLMTSVDGSVYLLHDSLESQYVIDKPAPCDLLVLKLLRSDFIAEEEIHARLREAGHRSEAVGTSLRELEAIGVLESDLGRSLLSAEDLERFDRQLIYLSDIAHDGESGWLLQQKLRSSRVVVLGCGGLGSWAATGLTLGGVGHLTLIDDDTVELSNLNRQLLFRTADIGRSKVEAAAESLTNLDPALEVHAIKQRLESPGEIQAAALGSDFLVMTADQPAYQLPRNVNEACLRTGTPWISAGQIPPLIRIGPTVLPGLTPCHECQESRFHRDFPQYDALATHRSRSMVDAATLGAASGTIGSLIAMEVTHHLTGVVPPASLGQAMIMDLQTMTVESHLVEADPTCKCRRIAE